MSQLVRVYWNLHKQCWSVQDAKSRRVVDHKQEIALYHCRFRVYESGRQRVIATKKKNVHAYVEGRVVNWVPLYYNEGYYGAEARYNPYETETFQVGGKPILYATRVLLTKGKRVLIEVA